MLSVRASAVVVSLALIMVAAPVRAQAPVVLRDYEQYLAEEVAAKESNPILDWYLIGLAAGLVSTFNITKASRRSPSIVHRRVLV